MSFPALSLQLIDVTKGKARDFDLTLSVSSGSLVVADVTGAWFTVKARETDADGDKILQKTLNAGITLTGTSGTSVTGIVQLTNSDTDLLTVGRTYFFDLQIDTTSRGPELASRGRITVRQPITVANT